MNRIKSLVLSLILFSTVFPYASTASPAHDHKTARINAETPPPDRFIVQGSSIIDRYLNAPVFFRGLGYSPYQVGETPVFGASPGDDGRYRNHFARLGELAVNYLHVFPHFMPVGFFAELDQTELVYGQDIWVMGDAEDFLDETFLSGTLDRIKAVIDHTYSVGRPDRLVLFSIGDELQASSIMRTDSRHPTVTDYQGKYLTVSGRTPTEVALARLIDAAIDYELTRYGRRHLYCHTSWTHVGPLADGRPDIEVSPDSVLLADMGDLLCLNVFTYSRGVTTSQPGSVTGTTYQGYLEELAASVEKPVLVTQVGLSTSPVKLEGAAPGFGGQRIEDVPQTLRAVWKDIRTAKGSEKFGGMVFFEFADEWWKSGEYATDSNRQEPKDPEEWFGIYAQGENNNLVPKGLIPDTVRALFIEP